MKVGGFQSRREIADMKPMNSVKRMAREYIVHTGHTATARLQVKSKINGVCRHIPNRYDRNSVYSPDPSNDATDSGHSYENWSPLSPVSWLQARQEDYSICHTSH